MKRFIGVKNIKAVPMNRQEYNDYRGWELSADEDGTDFGYLVEYLDGGQANHPDHDGYISWSPTGVFERAYRPIDNMTFGLAIEAMKKGYNVCRYDWLGKGMFIFIADEINFHTKADLSLFQSNLAHIGNSIAMKTDQDDFMVGWLASQADMLAEDWMIIT